MSDHGSFRDWKFGQPSPAGLIDNIVECVRANPGWPMFGVTCDEDAIIGHLMGCADFAKPLPASAASIVEAARARLEGGVH